MTQHRMDEPVNRSWLRRLLGREAYIAKRRAQWWRSDATWASRQGSADLEHLVVDHQSLILRPLKDVEMYLQENKRTNLRIAGDLIDGVVLEPGETFSFWKLVGRPTARKGYLEGLILNAGSIDTEVGGGLCQMGNLLFWLFAHTPLDITERHRHGYDVFPDQNRTLPFGSGATLAFNHIDLQVTNSTTNRFALNVWQDDTHLHGAIRSERPVQARFVVEERNHRITQQHWGGYSRHNQLVQVVSKPDGAVDERLLVVNDALMMYSPLLEAGPPRV